MLINVYEMNTYHTGPTAHDTEEECVKAITLAPSAYKFTLIRKRTGEWIEVDLSNKVNKNVEIPVKKAHLMRFTAIIALACFLTSCMGRPATPVNVRQVGDSKLSCSTIRTEMLNIEEDVRRLLPQSDKTAKNVGLGIAGLFLIVPWFFMDLSEAEKQEINAYQQRANHLERLAAEKNCSI